MKKIFYLLVISLFLASCWQTKVNDVNSWATNIWTKKELNTDKIDRTEANTWKIESLKSTSTGKTENKDNSDNKYMFNLIWDQPFWNLVIDGNKLTFSIPKDISIVWCREKIWYLFCERDVVLEKNWNDYTFKAKDVKGKISEKDCSGLNKKTYKYNASVTFNDEKTLSWCVEEKQTFATWDNTFRNKQKGKVVDLEKALGIKILDNSLKWGNYIVEDIFGYYIIFSLDNFTEEDQKESKNNKNDLKSVLLLMKKTEKWWQQIWKTWESYQETCENAVKESPILWELDILEGWSKPNPV